MKQDKTHIMVDIETLDVEPSAVILSIGACLIHNMDHTFYVECNPDTQYERTKSQSTIQWWQFQVAKGTYMPAGQMSLGGALSELHSWIHQAGPNPVIWCKGTDFDVKILAHAFNQYNLPIPWKHNNVRDLRTLKKLHPQLTYPGNQVPHHALQDALHQTRELNAIFVYNDRLQWE